MLFMTYIFIKYKSFPFITWNPLWIRIGKKLYVAFSCFAIEEIVIFAHRTDAFEYA